MFLRPITMDVVSRLQQKTNAGSFYKFTPYQIWGPFKRDFHQKQIAMSYNQLKTNVFIKELLAHKFGDLSAQLWGPLVPNLGTFTLVSLCNIAIF